MPKQVMLWFLSLINLDELGKNMIEYASLNLIIFYIVILFIVLIIVCVIYYIYKLIHSEKVNIITIISIMMAIFSCSAIYALFDSYNSMCRDYYAEAEELCKAYRYQDAKVFYQKISDYRDSQQKIAECDYQSAQYYFQVSNYKKAYSLLFPWLAGETRDITIIENMKQLLKEKAGQISTYCKESGIFQDVAWMLGKWSDEKGNYFLFRIKDNEKNYFIEQNFDSTSKVLGYKNCNYENGLYLVKDEEDTFWICAVIFCPISNNSAYVYNTFSGQMFLFRRE